MNESCYKINSIVCIKGLLLKVKRFSYVRGCDDCYFLRFNKCTNSYIYCHFKVGTEYHTVVYVKIQSYINMTGHRLEFKDGSIIHIKDYFVKAKSYQFDNTCYHCAFYHHRMCHLNEDPITKRLSCVHNIKIGMDSTAFIKI